MISISIFLLDGNGFKTSTMRLGADVIVFSRCPGIDGGRFGFHQSKLKSGFKFFYCFRS